MQTGLWISCLLLCLNSPLLGTSLELGLCISQRGKSEFLCVFTGWGQWCCCHSLQQSQNSLCIPKVQMLLQVQTERIRKDQTPDCWSVQGINCLIGFAIFEEIFSSEQLSAWWRKALRQCWTSASPPSASAHKATQELFVTSSAPQWPRTTLLDLQAHRDLSLHLSRIHTWCPVWGITPCISNRGVASLERFHTTVSNNAECLWRLE